MHGGFKRVLFTRPIHDHSSLAKTQSTTIALSDWPQNSGPVITDGHLSKGKGMGNDLERGNVFCPDDFHIASASSL